MFTSVVTLLPAILSFPGTFPDNKVYGANMGPTWGRQDTGVSHVGCRNFAIWVLIRLCVTMFRFVAKLTATSTLCIVSVTTLCVSRLVAVLATKLATTTLGWFRSTRHLGLSIWGLFIGKVLCSCHALFARLSPSFGSPWSPNRRLPT